MEETSSSFDLVLDFVFENGDIDIGSDESSDPGISPHFSRDGRRSLWNRSPESWKNRRRRNLSASEWPISRTKSEPQWPKRNPEFAADFSKQNWYMYFTDKRHETTGNPKSLGYELH